MKQFSLKLPPILVLLILISIAACIILAVNKSQPNASSTKSTNDDLNKKNKFISKSWTWLVSSASERHSLGA